LPRFEDDTAIGFPVDGGFDLMCVDDSALMGRTDFVEEAIRDGARERVVGVPCASGGRTTDKCIDGCTRFWPLEVLPWVIVPLPVVVLKDIRSVGLVRQMVIHQTKKKRNVT
jgi:hypothetical protein